MITISKKISLALLAVIVIGGVLLVTVHYTSACRLEKVSLNQREVADWTNELGLDQGKSIYRQPVDSLAWALLGQRNIFKVDIDYSFPGEIDILVNNFEPVCFVLDKNSGKLFGLNNEGRVISLENLQFSWEHPVLTSLEAGRLFGYCQDTRAGVLVRCLEQLRKEKLDLYGLIYEIDLGSEYFVRVALSGLDYRLKIRAEHFCDDMNRFVDFVSRFDPQIDSVTSIDLRCDGMVICSGGER